MTMKFEIRQHVTELTTPRGRFSVLGEAGATVLRLEVFDDAGHLAEGVEIEVTPDDLRDIYNMFPQAIAWASATGEGEA